MPRSQTKSRRSPTSKNARDTTKLVPPPLDPDKVVFLPGGGGVSVELAEIPVDTCREWVRKSGDFNSSNIRGFFKNKVAQFAKDMAAEEWVLIHQGIAFSEDGILLDGQHRLAAAVAANSPLQCLIFRGLSDDANIGIDSGKTRQRFEVLRASGHDITRHEAAVLRELIKIANHQTYMVVSDQELASYWSENPTWQKAIQDTCSWLYRKARLKGVSTIPVMTAVASALICGGDPDRLKRLCEILITGGVSSDDPDFWLVGALRDKLIGGPTRRNTPREVLYQQIKWIQGVVQGFLKNKPKSAIRRKRKDYSFVPELPFDTEDELENIDLNKLLEELSSM